MHVIKKAIDVIYPAEAMYDLVSSIADYPKFLPWCRQAKILSNLSDDKLIAELTVGNSFMQHTFSTTNTYKKYTSIEMQLFQGPLKSLHGTWVFKSQERGCKIEVELSFELQNRLLALAIDAMLQHVIEKIMQAFVLRAEQVIGKIDGGLNRS